MQLVQRSKSMTGNHGFQPPGSRASHSARIASTWAITASGVWSPMSRNQTRPPPSVPSASAGLLVAEPPEDGERVAVVGARGGPLGDPRHAVAAIEQGAHEREASPGGQSARPRRPS